MKMVKDQGCIWGILHYRGYECGGKVCSYGLNLGLGFTYFLPELIQSIRPLTITDIYYLTILEIHDYSLVYMALADCKLIDTDIFQSAQVGIAIVTLKITFLYILDCIP